MRGKRAPHPARIFDARHPLPAEAGRGKEKGYIPPVSMMAIGMIATIANDVSTSVDAASVS